MLRIIRIAVFLLLFSFPAYAQNQYSVKGEWEAETISEAAGFSVTVTERLVFSGENAFSAVGNCEASYGKGKNPMVFKYAVKGVFSIVGDILEMNYDTESFQVEYEEDKVPALIPRPLLKSIFESNRKRVSAPASFRITWMNDAAFILKNLGEKGSKGSKYLKIK